MSSQVAMPMDTSTGSSAAAGDMDGFKSLIDNEVDAKPNTDDSSEGGDEPVASTKVVEVGNPEKHVNSNGHGPVKKVSPEIENLEKSSAVKEQVQKTAVVEEQKQKKEEAKPKEDDTPKGDEEESKVKEVKKSDTGEDELDETDGSRPKDEEAEAEPALVKEPVEEKKPKEKSPKKPKVVKEPAKTPSTSRAKKPRVSNNATIGELDTPVAEQVKSDGLRRERKQVERFVAVAPVREAKTPGVVVEGRGTKLGDIEYTAAAINSTKTANLSSLHRICFSRKGTTHEIKKNLKNFSGFPFEAGSKEYISRKNSMSKWNVKVLGEVCSVLGVKRPGTRDLMVEAILEFCLKPDEAHVDRKTPSSGGKRKSGVSTSRKSKSASPAKKGRKSKESPKPKSKGKAKAVKRKKISDDEDAEPEDSHHDESEPEEKDSDEEVAVAPPKKKKKIEKVEKALPPKKSGSRALPSRGASSGKKYTFDEDEPEVEEDEFGYESDSDKKKPKSKSPKKRSHEQPQKKRPTLDSDFEQELQEDEDADSETEKKKPQKSLSKPDKKVEKKPEKEKPKSSSHKEKSHKASSFKPPKKVKKAAEDDEEKDEDADAEEAGDDKEKEETAHSSEDEAPKEKAKALPESDGEEEAIKEPGFPSDSELRKVVAETVKSSDLKTVTMKMMLQTIYSKFADVDLTPKKEFIKAAVKDLL